MDSNSEQNIWICEQIRIRKEKARHLLLDRQMSASASASSTRSPTPSKGSSEEQVLTPVSSITASDRILCEGCMQARREGSERIIAMLQEKYPNGWKIAPGCPETRDEFNDCQDFAGGNPNMKLLLKRRADAEPEDTLGLLGQNYQNERRMAPSYPENQPDFIDRRARSEATLAILQQTYPNGWKVAPGSPETQVDFEDRHEFVQGNPNTKRLFERRARSKKRLEQLTEQYPNGWREAPGSPEIRPEYNDSHNGVAEGDSDTQRLLQRRAKSEATVAILQQNYPNGWRVPPGSSETPSEFEDRLKEFVEGVPDTEHFLKRLARSEAMLSMLEQNYPTGWRVAPGHPDTQPEFNDRQEFLQGNPDTKRLLERRARSEKRLEKLASQYPDGFRVASSGSEDTLEDSKTSEPIVYSKNPFVVLYQDEDTTVSEDEYQAEEEEEWTTLKPTLSAQNRLAILMWNDNIPSYDQEIEKEDIDKIWANISDQETLKNDNHRSRVISSDQEMIIEDTNKTCITTSDKRIEKDNIDKSRVIITDQQPDISFQPNPRREDTNEDSSMETYSESGDSLLSDEDDEPGGVKLTYPPTTVDLLCEDIIRLLQDSSSNYDSDENLELGEEVEEVEEDERPDAISSGANLLIILGFWMFMGLAGAARGGCGL